MNPRLVVPLLAALGIFTTLVLLLRAPVASRPQPVQEEPEPPLVENVERPPAPSAAFEETTAPPAPETVDPSPIEADGVPAIVLATEFDPEHAYVFRVTTSVEERLIIPGSPLQVRTTETSQEISLTMQRSRHSLWLQFHELFLECRDGDSIVAFDSNDGPEQHRLFVGGRSLAAFVGRPHLIKLDADSRPHFRGGWTQSQRFAKNRPRPRYPLHEAKSRRRIESLIAPFFDWSFPSEAVAPGAAWKRDDMLTHGGFTMVGESTTTFRGWKQVRGRQCADLELSGWLDLENSEDPIAGGASLTMDHGNAYGSVLFDPELHQPVEALLHADTQLTIRLQGTPALSVESSSRTALSFVETRPREKPRPSGQ